MFKTVYHGTNIAKLHTIMKDGLILPQGSFGSGIGKIQSSNRDQKFSGFVFLTTTVGNALSYALSKYTTVAIVLELDINTKLLLPDDIDDPDALTWMDSANSIQQVKIAGVIPFYSVRKLFFYTNGAKLIFECLPTNCGELYMRHSHLF
jgi:hypothetical protein